MGKAKEQKKNGYEDADLKQQLAAVEALEAEKAEIMAEALGRCSGIAKRIKNEIKTAKALGIPTRSFNALRKVRKLEKKLQEAAADVPDDEIELFEDMTGQFSFLQPEDGETASHAAARKATSMSRAAHEAEQAEGAAALDSIAAVH